jgi:hypothetical protein
MDRRGYDMAEEKMNYSVLFLILGLILRMTPALDIIHELMHYGWCNVEGIEVLELGWSNIKYAKTSIIVTYGGYGSEFMFYAVLVAALANRHRNLSSFFLGILIVVFFTTFISKDYNSIALKYYEDPAKVTANLIRWGILSGIILLGVVGIYKKGSDMPS